MGELLQFGRHSKKQARHGGIVPESEIFASKCMESLYDSLGYHTVAAGMQQPLSAPAAGSAEGGFYAEKALHDDICDLMRAYVTEALRPSAARHEARQRTHLNDLTGLVNQLLQRDGKRPSDLLVEDMKPLLQHALRDASLFYFQTNLFPDPSWIR